MSDTQTAYPEVIRTRVKTAGVTQTQLAAVLGVSQPSVSRRLSGAVEWSASELVTLAGLLEVDPGDLLHA